MLRSGMVLDTHGARVELIELIQEGGQASVWKAREITHTGRVVAAKLISTPLSQRSHRDFQNLRERIENEIALLGSLRHRFIGSYLYSVEHIDEENDSIVLGFIMLFAPIGTLRDFLRDHDFFPRDPLSLSERSSLIRRISQSVASIHNRGIVHSDIKAENILLQKEDEEITPILIDFGGAFQVHQKWPGLRTERYSAPELDNGTTATFKSDIYALGVVVFEILSGERQWKPSPETLDRLKVPNEHQAYLGLIRRMLATDPDKRPETEAIWKAFHTKETEQSFKFSSKGEKNIPFPIGRYFWRPTLHRMYRATKVLAFLKSSNPTSDARLLRRILDRFNFFGGSVHRVFGRSDFYVETWITEEKRDDFLTALQQFQAEQPHHHYDLSIEYYDIVEMVADKHEPDISSEDLISLIYERFSNGEKQTLIDKFIIRENNPKSDDIRFVLSMSPRNKLDKRQMILIIELIVSYLKNCRHLTASQKAVTKVMGSVTDNKLAISTPVKKIRNYTNIMLGIGNHLRRKALTADDFVFDYSTFIDMDGNGFVDGDNSYFRDDGMIPTKIMEEYF